MNRYNWLIENGGELLKFKLGDLNIKEESILLQNKELNYWYNQLKEYSEFKKIENIHGSHDYRLENILGKLWLLGMNSRIDFFRNSVQYMLTFLHKQLTLPRQEEVTFAKLYSYHDYETVLASLLSLCGFEKEPCIQKILLKRINKIYDFVKLDSYDIYSDEQNFPGVKKEWQPFIIKPDLYGDGQISIPTIHDFILMSSSYMTLNDLEKTKVNAIVDWIFDERYFDYKPRIGYFYSNKDKYNAKSLIRKFHLPRPPYLNMKTSDRQSLLFNTYIMSTFNSLKSQRWVSETLIYLDAFKVDDVVYRFPKNMIIEKKDKYFTDGGHMNIGENRRQRKSDEIISTYWMWLILNR